MEFLRFGSSIPGEYWGCCACDIIQNFNQDPDTPASIQLVSGDGGYPITKGKGFAFAGPTLRDIFMTRLRIGTFDSRDMPNHAFIAILTSSQLQSSVGKKWLAILKETGFEFIRTVSNSVYGGQSLSDSPTNQYQNHIFGLFRNIGVGCIKDPFTPPKQWTDLPSVVPEPMTMIGQNSGVTVELANTQRKLQREIWNKLPPPKILEEEEVVKAGTPVILAGLRTMFPPQKKEVREQKQKKLKEKGITYAPSNGTQTLYINNQ